MKLSVLALLAYNVCALSFRIPSGVQNCVRYYPNCDLAEPTCCLVGNKSESDTNTSEWWGSGDQEEPESN
jgi:hypothetical protein